MADADHIQEHIYSATIQAMRPPAIVRPYFDLDMDFAAMMKSMTEKTETSEAELKDWSANNIALRDKLAKLFEQHADGITSDTVSGLLHFANLIETKAEQGATMLGRFKKMHKKQVREVESIVGKGRAGQVSNVFERAQQMFVSEIEEDLTNAAFYRALAGKFDPEQEIDGMARTTQDLDNYFASIGAN